MSTRGSLTKCITNMIALFQQARYDKLAIICNADAKYYTLLSHTELKTKTQRDKLGNDRLVIYCTFGELKSMVQNEQLKLL